MTLYYQYILNDKHFV